MVIDEQKQPSKNEMMRHSAAHVMAEAVQSIFTEARFGIGPAIENGFYYDFDLPRSLTPDDLPLIEAKMKEIIVSDAPFIRRTFFPLMSRRLGAEISVLNPATTLYFDMSLWEYDGTNYQNAGVRLDLVNSKLQIWTTAPLMTDIATGLTLLNLNFGYIPLKLVVDFSTGKYVRVMLGSTEYDISAYAPRSAGSGVSPRLQVDVGPTNDATATAASIYVRA